MRHLQVYYGDIDLGFISSLLEEIDLGFMNVSHMGKLKPGRFNEKEEHRPIS